MSDYENKEQNDRYREGYHEGRSGHVDPLKSVVEGLFFGEDKIKNAGCEKGRSDREKYDGGSGSKGFTLDDFFQGGGRGDNSPTGARSRTSSGSGSNGGSGAGGGSGGPAMGLFGSKVGVAVVGLGLVYFIWVFRVMNGGGPETIGEFFVLMPGVLAVLAVGLYVGMYLIAIAAIIGGIVVAFNVIFG